MPKGPPPRSPKEVANREILARLHRAVASRYQAIAQEFQNFDTLKAGTVSREDFRAICTRHVQVLTDEQVAGVGLAPDRGLSQAASPWLIGRHWVICCVLAAARDSVTARGTRQRPGKATRLPQMPALPCVRHSIPLRGQTAGRHRLRAVTGSFL